MKPLYRLTPKAQSDLRAIARFSKKRWGQRQSVLYIQKLKNRIEMLAANPGLGRRREEINEEIFSFPESEHILFYIVTADLVEIIGILHNRMDFPANLN